MSYGAPFCRGVEPFLANLKAQLDAAAAGGLSGDPTAVSAQAVYDDISGFLVYIPFGSDCDRHTAEVVNAIARMKQLVGDIGLPRPDAEAPPEGNSSFGLPDWAKYAVFGVLGIAALHYLTPFFKPARRRLAGRNRR